ncbi:MAG: AAA family ATPase [Gemmatimonadaceae bacterium]|nr:AAA family ATPase [Gemmatimonadaceae bacterium]
MYESFFQLSERPFALTPNPRFVFYSARYRQAEDELTYAIDRKDGFMLLTGWPGTGKTTLCRDLIDKLDARTHRSALLFNPFLTGAEMLQAVLTEFNVPAPANASRNELLGALNRFLLDQLAAGRTCVAVFDEAQHMSTEFLEQIRVLSNVETAEEKLIQILLVGQPELLNKINVPGMAQLSQRVSVRCTLTHLDFEETRRYIYHRLEVAGAQGRVVFSRRALKRVHAASCGIPRSINAICDQTLLAGYVERTYKLDTKHVNQAIASLRGDASDYTHADFRRQRWVMAGAAGLALIVAAAALLLYRAGYTLPSLLSWRLS